MSDPDLRRAEIADCPALTDIALRAKAHWGYDRAFMEACRDELAVTPETLALGETWLAETVDGVVLGFVDIRFEDGVAEVHAAFVDPDHMGRRVGARLWSEVEAVARRMGARRIGIDSDPNAVGFYQRMGAVRTGSAPSGSIAGRSLPRLEKRTA